MSKSQNQLVLNHLIDHGYITDLIARNYGVRRLASRIHDLIRIGGVRISSDIERDDAGVRYALYTMSTEDRNVERHHRDVAGWDWRGEVVKAAT